MRGRRGFVLWACVVAAAVIAAGFLARPPSPSALVALSPAERLEQADAALARAAVAGSDEVFYFAYGANINRHVFVDRRGFHPSSAEAARSSGYTLVFEAIGVNFVEPAFATLRRSAGHDVHGVLYRLPRREIARLNHLEDGYEPAYIDVTGERSGPVHAYTYAVPAVSSRLTPSRRYLNCLRVGARESGLPAEYVAWLDQQPSTHIPVLSTVAERVAPFVESAFFDDR